MRILYILGDYKPDMSANGVCSNNVINQLISEGHEVTVLCNTVDGVPNYAKKGNLTVVRVKPKLVLRLNKKSDKLCKTSPLRSRFYRLISTVINKLQLTLTLPWWPRVSFSEISRFKKAAIKLHRENRFDAVVSVYTPVYALLAGYGLKKRFPEIKYYPYFLDSLSGGYGPRFFSKEDIVKHGLKIEKRIFPYADRIVIMKASLEHHKKYNAEFVDKLTVLDVPTFCKGDGKIKDTSAKKQGDPIKFLYVGSIISAKRDPSDILRVVNEVREDNITCEFVGTIDCQHLFEPLKKKLGDRLILSGQLPHDEVMRKIAEADVLLNIGCPLPTMIPCKIFEYLVFGKPIISTYINDDEPSIPHLKNYPLALLLDCRSTENFGEKISEFLEKTQNVSIDEKELAEIYRLNSPVAFTEIITRE